MSQGNSTLGGIHPNPCSQERFQKTTHVNGLSLSIESWSPLHRAFLVLLQGYKYAEASDRDIWDYAVEIEDLKNLGLTGNDLRWMVCNGWVVHAAEIEKNREENRTFCEERYLSFAKDSCFVLTDEGVPVAEDICATAETVSLSNSSLPLPIDRSQIFCLSNSDVHQKPLWDPERNRLYVGRELVKEFKLPSPNQGTILMAFEEEGWPPRIDDPLPPSPEIDPKARLRYTIKSLNKKQKKRLIRFMGDGSGEGIIWEWV